MTEYMGTHQAAEKWGRKQSTISGWCRDGLVLGAEQDKEGSPWRIPVDALPPTQIHGKGATAMVRITVNE